MIRRFFIALSSAAFAAVCVSVLFAFLPVSCEGTAEVGENVKKTGTASEISVSDAVTDASGFDDLSFLCDGDLLTGYSSDGSACLTAEYSRGIGSLYFIYYNEYGEYAVTDNDTGKTKTVGQGSFLHDYIDLSDLFGHAPSSVTVSWDSGHVAINEMYIFTLGDAPDYVQQWELPAEEGADMILFSTHGDDEQLFFAGILPYYANALGYRVQVVYLTNHRSNSDSRVHEMLNGLWAVGCTIYPVFGSFSDFLYDSIEKTYSVFETQGVSRDDIIEFCVEQIRRFKPLVIVAHDFDGEYGHGQHMVYADCVAAALEASNDASYFPDSADEYGVWDVPKAYFHLYEENQIVMDWDTPMEELDGMTPFEVTQKLGFPCHVSQQWTWFNGWINGKGTAITKASEIEYYSPCLYGLYRSTVGPDIEKNDFFENLITYEEAEAAQNRQNSHRILENKRLEMPKEASSGSYESLTSPTETDNQTETAPSGGVSDEDDGIGKIAALFAIGVAIISVAAAALCLISRARRQQQRMKK